MSNQTDNTNTETNRDPESYVRINITKGAKGEYRGETTVSYRWTGSVGTGAYTLGTLLKMADDEMRIEIGRREAEDRLEAGVGDGE